jgi:hypothetical protein
MRLGVLTEIVMLRTEGSQEVMVSDSRGLSVFKVASELIL